MTDISRDAGRLRPLRALFLGSGYAGHATRFASLEQHVSQDKRFDASFRRVTGWRTGGSIERLALLPRGLRGRIRATLEASALARFPRPDVIWTSVTEVAAPYLWSQVGPLQRPMVLDLDSTWSQLDAMAQDYKGRSRRTGLARQQALARERMFFSRVSHFTPWSEWAAQGLRDAGVPSQRISVIPPGVDTEAWRRTSPPAPGERLRLLFVGGNFERKGGDMLLDVMRSRLGETFELDIVTRDPVQPGRNVRVHQLEQADTGLRELYDRADLFVMPSRGECFGIATVEAMASSLPVVVSMVGAAPEIVDRGKTGWLIQPSAEELARALKCALEQKEGLRVMGARARRAVEMRFNAAANNAKVADLVHHLVEPGAPNQGRSDSVESLTPEGVHA